MRFGRKIQKQVPQTSLLDILFMQETITITYQHRMFIIISE